MTYCVSTIIDHLQGILIGKLHLSAVISTVVIPFKKVSL